MATIHILTYFLFTCFYYNLVSETAQVLAFYLLVLIVKGRREFLFYGLIMYYYIVCFLVKAFVQVAKQISNCLTTIIGGSCHKYHFCRDKTRPLSRQKYACRDKRFVATKLCLSRQKKNNCHNKNDTRVCRDETRLLSR